MKWELGRQGTGYYKLKLFESKIFKCDCYLLKYPTNSEVPFHLDKVKGHEHHRLNMVINHAIGGGFYIKDQQIKSRVIRFRPDLSLHRVDKVIKGTRLVLSFGWLREKV